MTSRSGTRQTNNTTYSASQQGPRGVGAPGAVVESEEVVRRAPGYAAGELMPSYGFRLFEVQLRERGGHKPQDVSKVGSEHLAVYVERLLNERLKDRTLVGLPATESSGEEPPMDDAHRNQPGLRVEDVERVGNMVLATMYFGRYSDFSRGLALPGGEDADLKDIAFPGRFG